MKKNISVSSLYAPLRICAEMCLYYYVLALFTMSVEYNVSTEKGVYGVVSNIVSPRSLQLTVLVGTCLALGFLIVRVNSAVLRFLLSLLPGLSFLMNPLEPMTAVLAAAWAYYVICMTVGNFEVYLDMYRKRARLMFVIALTLTCGLIIYHFGNDAWYGTTLFGGETFGLFFFVLTVFALRGMRLSFGAPAKMRAFDALHVVALPVIIIVLFFLLRGAVPAFTWVIARITRVLTLLYQKLFPREQPNTFIPDEDFNAPTEEANINIPAIKETEADMTPISGTDPQVRISGEAWLWVFIVILAAVLVYIAVREIRSRRKNYEKPKLARDRIERMPREKISHRRSGDPAISANAKKIRRIYRSYLDFLHSFGLKRFPSDTSKDVLDNSSKYLEVPENAELRELYIAARYGDPKDATAEQAAEARRCLTVIQNRKPDRETVMKENNAAG